MQTKEALEELVHDLNVSLPWKTPETRRQFARDLAARIPAPDWPNLLGLRDHLPSALDLGDADEFEDQLERWNNSIRTLLRAFAGTQPQLCLSVFTPLLSSETAPFLIKELLYGFQEAQLFKVPGIEQFVSEADRFVADTDCNLQRFLLSLLLKTDDPSRQAFRVKHGELSDSCGDLKAEFAKFL